MLALEEQQRSIAAMKANLRAMKMNRGRANIERDIAKVVAKQRHKEAIERGVSRFLKSLSWGLAQVVQEKQDAMAAEERKRLAREAEVREGMTIFLKSLSLLVSGKKNGRSLLSRCTEFTGSEMTRAKHKFMYFLSRQHPRLFENIQAQGPLSRHEREMIAACVRYARYVAGEIIKTNDVNEGERLTGEVSLEVLEMQVRRKYRFSPTEFRSKRRFKDLTMARQEFMWLAKKHTTHSLPEIGRYLGGLDHTTILHGAKVHEDRLRKAVG